jgi:hypothetical protein
MGENRTAYWIKILQKERDYWEDLDVGGGDNRRYILVYI